MAKDTFDKGREFLEDSLHKTREKVDDLFGDVRRQWKRAASKLPDDWDEASKQARHFVREQPFTAVALAAGVGFLLGLLLGRSRD